MIERQLLCYKQPAEAILRAERVAVTAYLAPNLHIYDTRRRIRS
jgi:hypothetical protein